MFIIFLLKIIFSVELFWRSKIPEYCLCHYPPIGKISHRHSSRTVLYYH